MLLGKAASLRTEDPHSGVHTNLYGGKRYVDWSQFRPRGHYTHSTELRRYFRAMMWLGRADLGFTLARVDPATTLAVNVERERRDALLLTMLLDVSGELGRLAAASHVVDFMVGRADNVTVDDAARALQTARISRPEELVDPAALARFDEALSASGGRGQQIRSQAINGDAPGTVPVAIPKELQLFGQRFVIDSFVLSRVVYDSIEYRGEKVQRRMPTGLDAMAALGSNHAVRALAPELERYHYASNLLAARRVVDTRPPEAWRGSAYDQWLATLRTLVKEVPPDEGLPQVMQRGAWQAKKLRTALGSWTELRHDTVLYAKQSYTASTSCEYPEGFVEPYPRFFAALADLSATLSTRTGRMPPLAHAPARWKGDPGVQAEQAAFFERFAGVMRKLEGLATKELAAKPFSAAERAFIKKTIDIRGGGSGPPRYDGWYPSLFYGTSPSSYAPVVADVHTDSVSGNVLEEGVGDAELLVVAVDNGPHRTAYVGPAYSYYEFKSPGGKRLTDEEWQDRLASGELPPKPAFTAPFQGPALARDLAPAPPRSPTRRLQRER